MTAYDALHESGLFALRHAAAQWWASWRRPAAASPRPCSSCATLPRFRVSVGPEAIPTGWRAGCAAVTWETQVHWCFLGRRLHIRPTRHARCVLSPDPSVLCFRHPMPGIVGASIGMPDIHSGYGFAIGNVAAFDMDADGVVSPGGVGFDINCERAGQWEDGMHGC